MNAPIEPSLLVRQRLHLHVQAACQRIAPTWPLDRFIAVNPYWGFVDRPIGDAAAVLGTLAGTRLTMPREWFAACLGEGALTAEDVHAAWASENQGLPGADPALPAQTLAALASPSPALPRLRLVTDLCDAGPAPRAGMGWSEIVTHQVSQHCAAYFDEDQSGWRIDARAGLYASWREQVKRDRGLPWPRAAANAADAAPRADELPTDPAALMASALDALGIGEAGRTAYLSAVLAAIGGWAAWCGYARWQARLEGADDASIEQLLAIRLGWEWLLLDAARAACAAGAGAGAGARDAAAQAALGEWAASWHHADAAAAALATEQRVDWLAQAALEHAYQRRLIEGLKRAATPITAKTTGQRAEEAVAVQAVFCIDVRSEVFRRALEASSAQVRTCGFAGFFGLLIAYQPLGSELVRPQLPGLLAPALRATDAEVAGGVGSTGSVGPVGGVPLGTALIAHRRAALARQQRWAQFRHAPASAFSFVETLGLRYGATLIADSLPRTTTPARWEDEGLPADGAARIRPCLPDAEVDPQATAAMLHGVLNAMGLVRDFAPLLLLVGHGSQSANNPHAAGLDCGACGGQTGEVNARVLADALNRPAVRQGLRALGVDLPDSTHVLPALHNTTTDQVLLYDTQAVPPALRGALSVLQGWLAEAACRARAERAPGLGLAALAGDAPALERALCERANDWAQVRPEWGLADNAAFIVAPRARTRHLDLRGRCFLHDYDHALDPTLAVLTLIMTAPMVVTNWINLQYHASTVDNVRYGSGDKVLHNVVGGRLGVFEGNGGDLRIGLPMQSLHDGQVLRHTPLRLSVFIEAPRASLEQVISAHTVVQHLLHGGWLHLLRIEPGSDAVERWRPQGWQVA